MYSKDRHKAAKRQIVARFFRGRDAPVRTCHAWDVGGTRRLRPCGTCAAPRAPPFARIARFFAICGRFAPLAALFPAAPCDNAARGRRKSLSPSLREATPSRRSVHAAPPKCTPRGGGVPCACPLAHGCTRTRPRAHPQRRARTGRRTGAGTALSGGREVAPCRPGTKGAGVSQRHTLCRSLCRQGRIWFSARYALRVTAVTPVTPLREGVVCGRVRVRACARVRARACAAAPPRRVSA